MKVQVTKETKEMGSARMMPEPGSPEAPKYWADETSGRLAYSIRKYLTNPDSMTARDIDLVCGYFVQWIESPAWDLNPFMVEGELARLRSLARSARTVADLQAWIDEAVERAMDPL